MAVVLESLFVLFDDTIIAYVHTLYGDYVMEWWKMGAIGMTVHWRGFICLSFYFFL